MAVFTAIATAIAGALGMTFAAASTATFIAVTATALQLITTAAFMFGGIALSSSFAKKTGLSNSPTYAQAILQTQTNPDLPVPLLYGTVKLAGNRIWQSDPSDNQIKRIVAFTEGEITDFTDIKLNDISVGNIAGNKVEKFYGTNSQGLPSMVTLDKVGSLRNIAYLAITCNKTDKIDINYNLTCIVKGRKIRVYTTPTQYEIKYSENPAWVMFDFLTSYNGLGIALDNQCNVNDDLVAELFDLQSFIESAAFCDEEIETNGVKTPRFTFNMIFDSQTSARDLIDEVNRNCRGGLFTRNGKLQFKIDKPEPVSQIFTKQDIVKGSETFQLIPAEENYEILRCSYVSPEHEWQKVEAFAELPTYRYGAPVEHSVNIYSCTNFQQASRLAWYYVNSKRLCPYFGSFQTDYRAYSLEVGDVIQFDSLLMGLNDYKVKITSVNDDGSGTFTVNWRNYDERLYNDTLGSQEPHVLVSDLSDIASYPDDVQNFNVIQSGTNFSFTWQYNQNLDDVYEIRMGESWETGRVIGKMLRVNDFKYTIPSKGLYKFWIKAFNNYNYSKNPTLDIINIDSIPNIDEIISFDLIKTATGKFYNTYKYQDTIKLVPLVYESKTFNILNNMKGEFYQTKAYQDTLKFEPLSNMQWETTDNSWGEDTYYQENGIWGAETYKNGSYESPVYDLEALADNFTTLNIDYFTLDENALISVKWRYSSDNQKWSEWEELKDSYYKYRYFQIKIEINSNSQVIINKCEVLSEIKILWHNTQDNWGEGDEQYYQNLGIWGALTKAYGTYESQVYDIGLEYDNVVSFDFQYTSVDEMSNITVYWQTSSDGDTWNDWEIINNGTYTFRFFRVRVEFNSYNSIQTVLTTLKIKVDIQEKQYTEQIEVTDANAGFTIHYNFVKKPAIVATVADNIAKYAVIDNETQTNKQATIYVYNNLGELTTAKVNLLLQGY